MNVYGLTSVDQIAIEPAAQPWYRDDAEEAIAQAYETVYEWDYASDAHGYCHERSMLVGLLREIERLRASR